MSSWLRTYLFVFLSGWLGVAGAGQAAVPGPLVDTKWLAEHLGDVVLLDVRKELKSFTSEPPPAPPVKIASGKKKKLKVYGHIPGARFMDFDEIRTKRDIDGRQVEKMLPGKGDFEALIRDAGVNRDSAIVIVTEGMDTEDLAMGTRLYWQLKYYGHDNVAVLDGGTARWIKEERDVTSKSDTPAPGDWVAGEGRPELLATTADVAAAADKGVRLIDSRPLSHYLGTAKRDYVAAYGHIPGAKLFASDLLTGQGPAEGFLPPEEYRKVADVIGVDMNADTIAYCNSGHFASAMWFVMSELLGNKKVRVYDGSMHEWALEDQPVRAMVIE